MQPFKIEAVVEFNKGEALVLNRSPKLLYEKEGAGLVGKDGPFRGFYRYEEPRGRFKAFAGAEFDIPMVDGTVTKAYGQYWDTHNPDFWGVTYSTVKQLQHCYVYTGGNVDPEFIQKLRSEYTGCVYPYRDYEAVINYIPLKLKYFREKSRLEEEKGHLITHIKTAHRVIEDMGWGPPHRKLFPQHSRGDA